VKFAEDAFKELGGAEKLQIAIENLVGRLNGCGVSVTADEADTLIRAAFQTLVNYNKKRTCYTAHLFVYLLFTHVI
jgi:hypothetical protein